MDKLLMPFYEKPQIIRKSNELIEARYKLNLAEQRVVLLLASEISPNDEDFKSYEIRVADFAEMFGLQKCKSMYSEIEKAAEGLLSQKVVLQDNETKEVTNWLSYVKYVKGSGTISLEFHKSLKPYLLQLKSHFTQYHLKYVIDFNSQYSIRLYELLKMNAYKSKNGVFEKYIELQEYRNLLGIDKKSYPVFSDFRKYVIYPLVREISDKTDLYINEVKYGKTGRKITNITFVVAIRSEDETNQQQADLRIQNKKPEKQSENHPVIDSLISLGFSLETAKKYKNKHGVKKIERNIAYTLAKKQEGKVKDIPAYLNMAIEQDYASAWDMENQKKEQTKQEQVRLKKERLAKEKEEEKAIAEKKAQSQKNFERFLALPIEQQNDLRDQFMAVTDTIVRGQIQSAIRNGKNFYSSQIVLQNFKFFLASVKFS